MGHGWRRWTWWSSEAVGGSSPAQKRMEAWWQHAYREMAVAARSLKQDGGTTQLLLVMERGTSGATSAR
jgi:hypothetical protein